METEILYSASMIQAIIRKGFTFEEVQEAVLEDIEVYNDGYFTLQKNGEILTVEVEPQIEEGIYFVR